MPIFSFSGKPPASLGFAGGRLAPCPASPNCVCSDDVERPHAVAPFVLRALPQQAWQAAREAVLRLPRVRIVSEDSQYLHAECTSALFGFVDDLELHLRPAQGIIAVRSASRLGYADFGVNRKRVERLRSSLIAKGMIR